MEYFSRRFPEIGPLETRCIILGPGVDGLRKGKYAFLERYCEELKCDCRKVLFDVLNEAAPDEVLATISFGWERPEFYDQRFSSVENAGLEITRGVLDPLCAQSPDAEALLAIFREFLINDPAYVKRLEGHYWMFKRSLRPVIPAPRNLRKRR